MKAILKLLVFLVVPLSVFGQQIVTVRPLPSADAGLDVLASVGQIVTIGNTNTLPGYSYEWTDGGVVISTIPKPTYTVTSTKSLGFKVTDTYGCVGLDNMTVQLKSSTPGMNLATIPSGQSRSICAGYLVSFQINSTSTLPWKVVVRGEYNDGTFTSDIVVTNITTSSTFIQVRPTKTVTYSIVSVNDTASGSGFVNFEVLPSPDITLGSDLTICGNETRTFTVTPGYQSYVWNVGSMINTATTTITQSRWVVVDVTASNSCRTIDSLYITHIPDAQIQVADVFGCEGTTLQFNASVTNLPNVSYVWQGVGLSSKNVANPTVDVDTTTVYTLNVWDQTKTCNTSKEVTAWITKLPVARFSYVKDGYLVSFTNTGRHGTTWEWDFGDMTSQVITTSDTVMKHTYTINGSFNVWLTATNSCGTDTWNNFVIGVNSVGDLFSQGVASVFPNPVVDFVNITGIKDIVQINLVSLDGKILASFEKDHLQDWFQIDMQQYPAGVYMIQVLDDAGKFALAKIVKEK